MLKLAAEAKKIYAFLSPGERFRLNASMLTLILANLLDLAAIFVMGMIGVLTIDGTGNGEVNPNGFVADILRITGLTDTRFQNQIAIFGVIATLLFVSRTILSMVVVRKIYFFLGSVSTRMTAQIASRQFNQPINMLSQKSTQEILYESVSGIDALTLGAMASMIALVADVALLVLIGISLSIVNFWVTLFSILYLGVTAIILQYFLGPRTQKLGNERAVISIALNNKILEIFNSYRENTVRHRKYFMVEQLVEKRNIQSKVLAEFAFLPNVSKYVLESSVILGVLILSASQFILADAKHAVGTLAIFLAAGSRIAPALLRAQQGLMIIRNSLGAASTTIKTLIDLASVNPLQGYTENSVPSDMEFSGKVVFQGVTFCYPEKTEPAINDASFELSKGELIAVVGPSGSGKTTLVDLMMGLLIQNSGIITISDLSPEEVQAFWPGKLSYVPQNVYLIDDSVRQNVSLGYPDGTFSDEQIWKALEFARLEEFVNNLPNGLDERVGENGNRFSGGQRQRLGIARAVVTEPSILVLDEATNALDGATESEITESLSVLRKLCTVIVIAHREETVNQADRILLVQDSKVQEFLSWSSVSDLFASKTVAAEIVLGRISD
jgi:ATP-binding cassette, subfamily B, bacterial PglK